MCSCANSSTTCAAAVRSLCTVALASDECAHALEIINHRSTQPHTAHKNLASAQHSKRSAALIKTHVPPTAHTHTHTSGKLALGNQHDERTSDPIPSFPPSRPHFVRVAFVLCYYLRWRAATCRRAHRATQRRRRTHRRCRVRSVDGWVDGRMNASQWCGGGGGGGAHRCAPTGSGELSALQCGRNIMVLSIREHTTECAYRIVVRALVFYTTYDAVRALARHGPARRAKQFKANHPYPTSGDDDERRRRR